MLKNADHLTDNEVANLIKDCFSTLRADANRPYIPQTCEPWLERANQKHLAQEYLNRLANELDRGDFSDEIMSFAARFAEKKGISLEGATEERVRIIAEGVARALIETERCFLMRLDDSVTPYAPSDPLFASSQRDLEANIGLTVNELIAAYMRAKKPTWTPKTYRTHGPKLNLLAEYIGGDRPAEGVTRKDLMHFPDELLRLRRNHHTMPVKAFSARQTDNPEARIAASTATGILARTVALFGWAFQKGYISTNPAQNLSVTIPKQKKGNKGRRSFTQAEIAQLFGSPLFTGCLSAARRTEPGTKVIKDDQFWLPVLGYYTGARLSELIQLHLTDIVVDSDFPHISINEDGPEKPGDPDFKHVKSVAGLRIIPLHPDVMALGFAGFVDRQKKSAGSRKRLFFRVKYGADGHPSTPYSKKFGRLLSKVGLDDPQLVFHSFRHTMLDSFRNSATSKFVVDRIIGHQDQSAAGQYGEGISLPVAWATLAELKIPLSLTTLISTEGQGDAQ